MIELRHIVKKYGKLSVLDDLSYRVERGKITGVVGPNGSGKTTLIKCILGLIKPDQGEIIVGPYILNGNYSYKKMIGYMPQLARFPENLTVDETIALVKDIRAFERDWDEELYLSFNLENEKNKKIYMLSGGTRQKVSALIAFLFKPEILILDEPTAGLDPRASRQLKDKILKARAAGYTIILTSHIMSELEELADNIVFLLNGQLKFEGSVQTIMNTTNEDKLERAVASMMAEPLL
jgi:Cu-processing system ATP-binding protein